MSFDGLFTHAMVRELQGELQSGRVMKISQPYPYELMLSIRANRKTQTLLLSANPELRGYRLLPSPLPTQSAHAIHNGNAQVPRCRNAYRHSAVAPTGLFTLTLPHVMNSVTPSPYDWWLN